MSDIFKCFVFYIVLTVFEVTSIDFTINRENVLLGSTGILTLRCDITETDVETIYNIQIKQLRSSTLSRNNDDDWQRLAFMKISTNDNPTLDSAITPGDKDYVAGGSWDSTTPANTELTLSMNMEKLVCDDARTFKCDLSYYSNSQANKEVSKNSTFTAYVSGVDFTFSKEKVLLGSTGTLTAICDITETDVSFIYLIQIRRIKSITLSGSDPNDWQTLVLMESGRNESPTLTDDIAAVAASKDYVAGGSWDSTTLANTYLTLSMNIEKLVCDDTRYYRCELTYKSTTSGTSADVNRNATFSAYVKPQVISLITMKNGFIVEGSSPLSMATTKVGDELELTCNANIGSLRGTIIRWHRTSETSKTDDFIGYQPPQGTYDEGTAISDNQCGYTRVASIKYNVTVADAYRYNNLAFECYVTVSGDPYGNSYTSENNPRFYTDVNNPTYGDTDSTTDKNEINVAAGVMAAIVIASLIVGILIGVVFTWVVLNRKRTVTGLKNQNQHQPTSVSQETEIFNVPSHSPNTYEQLQNRTETESRMAYDSLNAASANSSTVPDSQSQYESLKHGGGGTSHTYAGLNNNQ